MRVNETGEIRGADADIVGERHQFGIDVDGQVRVNVKELRRIVSRIGVVRSVVAVQHQAGFKRFEAAEPRMVPRIASFLAHLQQVSK